MTQQTAIEMAPANGDGQSAPDIGLAAERDALLTETGQTPAGRRRAADRRLIIETPMEPASRRWLFLALALAVAAAHMFFANTYFAPAHWGNNQNAYLVAGKLLVTTGTTGFEPETPFDFVGWMWNMADATSTAPGGGWVYPKYPAGVPMLNGLIYQAAHWFHGGETESARQAAREAAAIWPHRLSPVCTTLALVATFFITRLLAGSFVAVLSMIMLGTITVVAVLTNNPNSHAPDLAFVCWGMYALIRWWQLGGWWRGSIAGFLLGFAVTIRYTEGLLVLPILLAVALSVRWRDWRSWLRCSVPLFAWAAPVVALAIFNWFTIGSLTGYDSTNESTGFTLRELARKWRWGIDQFYNTGLYFILPLSVLGMFMAFRWNWRVALLLLLWFVPGTLLYLAYYWGMNLPVWGFLRFFTSVLPAGVIAAAWLMHKASESARPTTPLGRRRATVAAAATILVGAAAFFAANAALPREWSSSMQQHHALAAFAAVLAAIAVAGSFGAGRGAGAPIAMGVMVAFPAAINIDTAYPALERDHTIATNLAQVSRLTRMFVPDGSVVFGHSQYLHNHLQFAGNYRLIGSDYIVAGSRPVPPIIGGPDGENPNPIQRQRKEFVDRVYGKMTRADRVNAAMEIVHSSLAAGKRVFIIQESAGAGALREALSNDRGLQFTTVARWTDPARFSPAAMGALATIGRDGFARREPWKWTIIEVSSRSLGQTLETPATQPADAPAGAPSTS